MTTKRKYTAVLMGSGRIAGGLEDDPLRRHPCTHVGAYNYSPRIKVAACSSKTIEHAREFAGKWGIPRYYDDSLEMIEKEHADIVSVCTPADNHREAVINASRCGASAIFCEKALATSLEEADEMIAECRKNSTHLTVNHTRRWCWDFRTVKEIMVSGDLGDMHSITGWTSGSLIHTGTHFFDAMHYFCGDATSVQGILTHSPGDDTENGIIDGDGYAFIEMENGVRAIINSVAKSYYIFEMELLFSNGRIRIGNGVHELWRSNKSAQYEDFSELHIDEFPHAPAGEKNPMVLAVEDILGSIDEDRDTVSTGEDARTSLETAFAIYDSHNQDGISVTPSHINRNRKILSK